MQCRVGKGEPLKYGCCADLVAPPPTPLSSEDDTARPRSGPGRVGLGGQRFYGYECYITM
eukprot:4604546-Heterocapsa_arctica.AAC.1